MKECTNTSKAVYIAPDTRSEPLDMIISMVSFEVCSGIKVGISKTRNRVTRGKGGVRLGKGDYTVKKRVSTNFSSHFLRGVT
jgi:hypothetical protein